MYLRVTRLMNPNIMLRKKTHTSIHRMRLATIAIKKPLYECQANIRLKRLVLNSIKSSVCTHNFKPVKDERSIRRSTDDFFFIPVVTWIGSYCYYCCYHLYLDFSPSRRSVWCLFSLLPLLTLTSRVLGRFCCVTLQRDGDERIGEDRLSA